MHNYSAMRLASHKFFGRCRNIGRLRFILPVILIVLTGCSALTETDSAGVVIARRAQIRSSTAVVAADLLDVVRGDRLTILGSTVAENSERWLRVRAGDAERTEGWIEARNVMPEASLIRSRQLAEEDRDTPAQATAQLRATANLRLAPDRTASDNILMKLDSGSRFEIVGWQRVAKPRTDDDNSTRDDAPRTGVATSQQNNRRRRVRGNTDTPEVPVETTELWYRVRLPASVSPAPAGWIYGQQVELSVPSDIIFYRTGREFVAWRRLDDESDRNASALGNRDAAAGEDQPGSWVILEKSSVPGVNSANADFDRIYVLGYDRNRQEHYSVYRSPDVVGRLPLRVETRGNTRVITVNVRSGEGTREVRLNVLRNDNGTLRVEVVGELQ